MFFASFRELFRAAHRPSQALPAISRPRTDEISLAKGHGFILFGGLQRDYFLHVTNYCIFERQASRLRLSIFQSPSSHSSWSLWLGLTRCHSSWWPPLNWGGAAVFYPSFYRQGKVSEEEVATDLRLESIISWLLRWELDIGFPS
jgi:hypothetical protein